MKMLRGISSCLWRTTISIKDRFPPQPGIRHSPAYYNLLRNDHFSSVEGVNELGGENCKNFKAGCIVDQSFAATHHADDGRKFQFATVVVKEMKKDTPSLQIWEHARTLIGGNPATLAVAFVSKPSESALRTVRAFANQLSAAANHHKHEAKETQEKEEVEAPSPAAHPPEQEGLTREAHCAPIIGYVMEDLGGEFESKESAAKRTLQGIPPRSLISGVSRPGSEQQQQELQNANAAGGVRGEGGGLGLVASTAAHAPLLNFSKIIVEDEDGEVGTLSDWENLSSECGQDFAKVMVDLKAADSDEEGEEAAAEDWKNGPKRDEICKESLVSFLNALVSFKNPNAESGGGGDLIGALRGAEQRSRMQNRGMKGRGGDREAWVGIGTGDGLARELEQFSDCSSRAVPVQRSVHGRHGSLQSDMLFGHVDGTISVGDNEKTGFSPSHSRREDPNYKLVLCVGHMPGAKAVAFHSSTTGLPRLPDLENAITENNPHMLLLGAPGFVFPDFIQRLATVFPASCRLQSGSVPVPTVYE